MRHLREVFGDQIKIEYKMGGLVRDMRDFYDPQNQISTMEQVAPHWRQASERHGMPVDETVFLDPKNDFRSTYPANIAYEAAQFQSKELAEKFLRRLREAAAAEHKFIHQQIVLTELAAEAGLDTNRFEDDIRSGRAEKAFYQDLNEARSQGISGFPSFIISNNVEPEMLLQGYRPFDVFEAIINKLTNGKINRRKPKDILAFIKKWRRVATQEVAEVFESSKPEAEKRLTELTEQGKLRRIPLGNGDFWEIK